MTLVRRLGRVVAGAAVLAVVCVAAPAALASLAAFVWPHAWTWSAVGPGRAGVLGADILGWSAWAVYVVGLAADVLALVRRGERSVPVGGGARTRAAGWVAGLILLVLPAAAVVGTAAAGSAGAAVVAPAVTSVVAVPLSPAARLVPAMATTESADTTLTEQSPVGTVYTVAPGDCLSTIAEHFYGDQGAWSEIWQANMDRVMPDGRRFTDPNLIYSGWTLVLPGAAVVPGPAPAPASAPTSTAVPAPASTVVPGASAPAAPRARSAGTGWEGHPLGSRAGAVARRSVPSQAVPVEPVHWVPETAALGVSTVVAAALTRRIRRGRAKARAARGDGDLVVDPAPADVVLEARTAPFHGAPVLDWLELANRHLTAALRAEGLDGTGETDVPPIHLVRLGPDGVELRLGHPVHWVPEGFVLTRDGAGWLLPGDVDRHALSAVAAGELAWLPLLVPVGDGSDGTYLLHLEPGTAVPVEGPAAEAMLRTWRRAAESWPWAEQLAVTDGTEPLSAERQAGCFEGQASVDARGTVLYLGDPSELSATARWTCASVGPHVDHGADPYRRRVVVTKERAVIEPWGIEVRPCLLDTSVGDALGNVLDEQSLLPDPPPDPDLGDVPLTDGADGTVPEPGAIEVRLLTFTPELVGLARPLPTDKRVRITELVAWLALRGDRGTTSAAILDHGIAGATAAKTVYNMISAARTALGHDADGAPRLRSDRSTGVYSVSPEVTVDVLRFEALVGAGLIAADEHQAAALCRMALELVEDTPVGNGSGRYGWWASTWEARVGRLAVKAARRLAELARVGAVDLDTARWGIGRARLAAADEEELVRVGMVLDAWAGGEEGQGRIDGAWAEAVRRAEERDPGSAPTEATEAVYAAIQRGWLADEPPFRP